MDRSNTLDFNGGDSGPVPLHPSILSGAGALLLLAWMLMAGVSTFAVHLYWRHVARKLDAPWASGVAVIIPVRGSAGPEPEARLARFLASCLAQRGAGFRLIFAVEDLDDPAAGTLAQLAAAAPDVALVVAGRATMRGQKVHNQLAALATLHEGDRFIAFADADVVLAPDWLAQLLRPLLVGRAHVASGYRWILPADHHVASRLCALMDWGVATAGRSRRWNLCWGGSMAIDAAALARVDLPRAWALSLLDDIVLTRAVWRAGMTVHAPHQVLVPSPASHGWRSLFEFGRRQHLLVRVHAPGHWWLAGMTLLVPVAGCAAAVAAAGQGVWLALGVPAAALLLQQWRASLRVGIARRVLPGWCAQQSADLVRTDRWLLPIASIVHLAIWLSSAVGRELTWAGRHYRLTGFARVELLAET